MQTIHQFYVSHENELMYSEKTIYNYIDAYVLDVRNYEAFQSFIDNNPDTAIVQMDSVIGTKGGKCLLTIHFAETSLMLVFLRESNTSQ